MVEPKHLTLEDLKAKIRAQGINRTPTVLPRVSPLSLPPSLPAIHFGNLPPSPESWRTNQIEVIEKIKRAFKGDTKVVVISAPTGFGKSLVNVAALHDNEGGYYLVTLTQLAEQIENDPLLRDSISIIKSMENYPCVYEGYTRANVASAPCQLGAKIFPCNESHDHAECGEKSTVCPLKSSGCTYYDAKRAAIGSKVAAGTVDYIGVAPGFQPRRVVVVDEAHDLENVGMRLVSLVFTERSLGGILWDEFHSKLEIVSDQNSLVSLLDNIQASAQSLLIRFLEKAKSELEDGKRPSDELLKAIKLHETVIRKIGYAIEDMNENRWVLISEKDRGVFVSLTAKPITVSGILRRWIGRLGDRYIFASATFPDTNGFLKDVGFDDLSVEVIEVESDFPPENAPIFLGQDVPFYHKNKVAAQAYMLGGLEAVAEKNQTRGLIHSHSYEYQKYITTNASSALRARLVVHTRENREATFLTWKRNGIKNSIFLSVNMTNGIDLPDDTCRWQFIWKTPFADIKDVQVAARMEIDPSWYSRQATVALMQACGRAVRSKTDFADTFILDSRAAELLTQPSIPKWFKARLKTEW